MRAIKLFALVSLTLSVLSCTQKEVVRENKKGLYQKDASFRSENIREVSYNFSINLSKANESETYSGVSTIGFELVKPINLSVDFVKGSVEAVIVNKQEVKDFTKNDNFILIPKKHMKKGKNTVAVSFTKEFSKTGSGLYRFKDETDNKVYVYTDFEPYDANEFAPLFDQPDLKAKYTLNVVTPDDWKVISSVQENKKAILENGVHWFFPESAKFSTYIFPLHAGPYKVWRKSAEVNGRTIPMGLFARQSLAKFVKPEFWFKITESGFKYFENYFSTPYPYTKYDQVIVPDFNSGAMENVAAVTFNERTVSRDAKPLRAQRHGLANVIMHEMAHMWFGNLVTMSWWNDLWLNESFATFMANSATHEATEFKEAWLMFFNRTKQWAYSTDQWRTTHPIEADIDSTEVALTNFDGITYGKGASSLKQLVFLIGVENFKKGLASYFKKFAEKNTKLTDFMGELQKNTKENLSGWTTAWLQKEGLNSVKAVPVCKEGKLKRIDFNQGFVSGLDVLRPHKTRVAIWTKSNVVEAPDKEFNFKYDKKVSSWKPEKEMNCPSAVFPNWDDHDYVKVVLDEKSLKSFSKDLGKISNPLLRSQVWASLWSMVRMAELKPEKMHEIIVSQLNDEKDSTVLNSVTGQISGGGSYQRLYYYYTDKEQAKKDRNEVASFFKNHIAKTDDTDLKKILFGSWITMSTDKDLASVKSCLTKCDFDLGFEIDQDRRWWLITKLAVYRSQAFEKSLKEELKRDKSRRAELSALSSRVLYSKDKKQWLDKIFSKDEKLALKEKNAILGGIVPSTQREGYLDFIDESFNEYSKKIDELPARLQRSFAYTFSPYYCGSIKPKESLSEKEIRDSKWSPGVKKALLQRLDVEERCLKIKKGA